MKSASPQNGYFGKLDIAFEDQISNLERSLAASKLHLKAENERCEGLQQQISTCMEDRLRMERKITELECQYSEIEKELNRVSIENQNLLRIKCDLEVAMAEADIYDQVVKENVNELENLCTTLREQRDEQNNYYKQKEASLKHEHEKQVAKIKAEKSEVIKNLTDMNFETINLRDELEHLRTAQLEWRKDQDRMKNDRDNLALQIRVLEKDLKMEKETVKMLTLKNNNLAVEVRAADAKRSSSGPISKNTVSMIEDLVGKFYEKKIQASNHFNDKQIANLKKQLSECQSALMEEKQIRDRLELQLETAEMNLSKAKSSAESLFELSVARTRNNLNKCNNLKLSSRSCEKISPCPLPIPFRLHNHLNSTNQSSTSVDQNNGQVSAKISDTEETATSAANSILTNVSSSNNSVNE